MSMSLVYICMIYKVLISIVAVLTAFPEPGDCFLCDNPSDVTLSNTCSKLSHGLKRTILDNERNQFLMRKAFFSSPTAGPVLLKVVYNVSFGENITRARDGNQIPRCSTTDNTSAMELNQTTITYGWTSSGVYTIFHPALLSMTQTQIPFAALRAAHMVLQEQRSPESDTFLWDGSYDLPTLPLNVHITSLSCIPSQDVLESAIVDINTQLKVYAGQLEPTSIMREMIGFTIPSTSVSRFIPPISSDIKLINIYSSLICFIYAIAMWLFIKYHYTVHEEKINHVMSDNSELVAGMVFAAASGILIEIPTWHARTIIWTVHIDNGKGVFLAAWLPQIFFYIFVVCTNIGHHVKLFIESSSGENAQENAQENAENRHGRLFTNIMQIKRCLSYHKNIHIILIFSFVIFGLLYTSLPAIILTFAYPTQMISMFTFVWAFLFAMTVLSAIMIKSYKQLTLTYGNDTKKKILLFVLLFLPFLVIMLYLNGIAVVFLYLLIIGRGSVVTNGPLFVLSLLPSAFLSGVAWIAKKVALNARKNTQSTQTPPNNRALYRVFSV